MIKQRRERLASELTNLSVEIERDILTNQSMAGVIKKLHAQEEILKQLIEGEDE